MQQNAWRFGGGGAPARQGTDVYIPKSAPPSPKASPSRTVSDVLDFAKYTTRDIPKASFSMSMSPWGTLSLPSRLPDHVPTTLPSSAVRKLNSRDPKRRDERIQTIGGERKHQEQRLNNQPRMNSRQEKVSRLLRASRVMHHAATFDWSSPRAGDRQCARMEGKGKLLEYSPSSNEIFIAC